MSAKKVLPQATAKAAKAAAAKASADVQAAAGLATPEIHPSPEGAAGANGDVAAGASAAAAAEPTASGNAPQTKASVKTSPDGGKAPRYVVVGPMRCGKRELNDGDPLPDEVSEAEQQSLLRVRAIREA